MALPTSPRLSPRLFGTDGIRATPGVYPLDASTVTALGFHLAATLRARRARPHVVLGGDTRESTPELCRWLAAGLAAGGATWSYVGVLPTPGVAFLSRRRGVACGIAVSASHNPYPDNGIKLLAHDGRKWSPRAEVALEERLAASPAAPGAPAGDGVELTVDGEAVASYLASLTSALTSALTSDRGVGGPLAGLRIALDCANGAASPFAPRLFAELGADVTALGAAPDGRNINQACGSTHPEALAVRMAAGGHDLGVAFDGDADRAILVDERGGVRDGDAILYLWATALAGRGDLEPRRIVATSMSNLGLEHALAGDGIGVVRCDVGDRKVAEAMRRHRILLGGEQSGHVIYTRASSTGDGLLTALAMAELCAHSGRPLSELLVRFVRFPQLLRNVRVARKPDLATLPRVTAAARSVEARLGRGGRLVLRYSGTEPLARIMIEGPDASEIAAMASEIATAFERDLAPDLALPG